MQKSEKREVSLPVLSISPLSNKYEFIMDFKWGTHESQIKVSQETFDFQAELVKELNKALAAAYIV